MSDHAVSALSPADPLGPALRQAVGRALTDFLEQRRADLAEIGPELGPLVDRATELTSGGKRFRPAFCVWSFVGAGGDLGTEEAAVVRAAASLELLHVSALVHDDVLDDSDRRRGLLTAHRRFAADHIEQEWLGDADTFGRNAAILLGDLLLMWSVELTRRSGVAPDRLAAAQPTLERMRTEVTAGQYLDVLAEHLPWPHRAGDAELSADLDRALAAAERVVEFKASRYTAVRPCQFGAALAGAPERVLDGLARFASPLGRAFQYRDDLLGVFGDPAVTGKPAGDDLREGKRTVLVAHAWAGTDVAGRAELASRLGTADLDADGVNRLREVITASGALGRVETMISELVAESDGHLAALDLTHDGRTALRTMADLVSQRTV